ncbi:MAG: hypothetical protein ACRDDH_05770 [Cetobacterium sp.]|uniref:hypothetical protein n=1 Tax=Cetobacterium sp. TaxID=2071632 RepID=UPI003EE70EDD
MDMKEKMKICRKYNAYSVMEISMLIGLVLDEDVDPVEIANTIVDNRAFGRR